MAAVNRAQFILIQQLNALKVIQAQAIDSARAHPLRFITMRALLPIDHDTSRVDADSLSFLLETDDRELPFLPLIEQQRFDAAVRL